MSSAASLDAGIVPPPLTATNARKRVLTDSEDTADRDLKRSRPAEVVEDNGVQKERKDKKKRRKRKHKVSIVQAAQESDENSPVVAPKRSPLRAKSLPVGVIDCQRIGATPSAGVGEHVARQPSAGPSEPVARASTPRNQESSVAGATVRFYMSSLRRCFNGFTEPCEHR